MPIPLSIRFPDSIFVLDNALYHHASIFTDFGFLIGIDLLFLPPYSPELNPIERVWKLVKKHATHNRYFQLLSNLKGSLSQEFSKHFRPNEELQILCVITYVVMYSFITPKFDIRDSVNDFFHFSYFFKTGIIRRFTCLLHVYISDTFLILL